jgi:hypothetical protein
MIMKTKKENQKMKFKGSAFVLMIVLILSSASVLGQEAGSKATLLRSDIKVTEIFAPEIKINSIQEDIGTLIGFYCGPMINSKFLAGVAGGVNLGHPKVNYGYFGIIGQYVFNSSDMVHFSSQLVMAYGTTKDYENPKSSPFDNFWNINGADFYLMEPGVNFELNISNRLVLVTGVSYRYILGLDETSKEVSRTHLTNEALSGVNFNIGLKFCREKTVKK